MSDDGSLTPPDGPPKPTEPANNKAPERWVSILGFVIVTKADLLAAAAFLLSLISVVYQFSSWIKGPSPSVYAPDVVYVFFDEYANNRTLVRFASQMSFVNTAETGHDAIVRDITLQVSAKGVDITHDWLSFVTVERNGTKFLPIPQEAAHPFPVVAGGAVSHTVSFAPLEQPCPRISNRSGSEDGCDTDRFFVTDAEFLNKIADVSALKLKFAVRFVGSRKPLFASCVIPIGVGLQQYLAENDWFAARCDAPTDSN